MYIYKKTKAQQEKNSGIKRVFFRFYILCENFSKIGPTIKKIPNFVNDPLKSW